MATRIQLRRDTAANWTAVNPVLSQGEEGHETDTGKRKVGNGTTAWVSLPYFGGSSTSALNPRGAYDATVTYQALDLVRHLGSQWRALRSSVGVTPVEGLDWTLFVQKGTDGTNGTNGTNGINGRGFTPRGAWATSTVYAVDDVVTSAGSTYRITTAHTSTTAPPGANYELWAAKGTDGSGATTTTLASLTDVTDGAASVGQLLGFVNQPVNVVTRTEDFEDDTYSFFTLTGTWRRTTLDKDTGLSSLANPVVPSAAVADNKSSSLSFTIPADATNIKITMRSRMNGDSFQALNLWLDDANFFQAAGVRAWETSDITTRVSAKMVPGAHTLKFESFNSAAPADIHFVDNIVVTYDQPANPAWSPINKPVPDDGSITSAKMSQSNRGTIICTSTTRPLTAVNGQPIAETDTGTKLWNTGTFDAPVWSASSPVASVSNKMSYADLVSDYVVSGINPGVPSPASLSMGIPLGRAIVGGSAVEVAALAARAFTASKDTYVELKTDGTYVFIEAVLNAAAPAITAGALRVLKVVTNATQVTAARGISREATMPKGMAGSYYALLSRDAGLSVGAGENHIALDKAHVGAEYFVTGAYVVPEDGAYAATGSAFYQGYGTGNIFFLAVSKNNVLASYFVYATAAGSAALAGSGTAEFLALKGDRITLLIYSVDARAMHVGLAHTRISIRKVG